MERNKVKNFGDPIPSDTAVGFKVVWVKLTPPPGIGLTDRFSCQNSNLNLILVHVNIEK